VLKKFLALATTLLLAAGISVVAVAAPASATHPTITGSYACNPATGTFDITWRVTGDTDYKTETATITQQSIATTPDLVGKTVKNTSYVEGVQTGATAGTTYTFKVWVQWTNHSAGDLVTQTKSLKIPSGTSCFIKQDDTVDCTAATVYLGAALTNANYINMNVRIGGKTYTTVADVDDWRDTYGFPDTGSGLVLTITKIDGSQIRLPITVEQKNSGILTFTYSTYLSGGWDVTWVQFDGHNWHFGADGAVITCGTQEASAALVFTDETCTTAQTVATGDIVGATWGEITYDGNNYSVTATAIDGYKFPGNQSTKTFTGSLSPPSDAVECHPEVPVTVPTAKAITECGTYGSVNVPADTDKIDYTFTGNGQTGINTVTAVAIAPYVLTGYPEGGWSFNLGAYYDCTIDLTIAYVQDCPVDDTNTWRVYNPTEDTIVVTYGVGQTHSATPGYSTFSTPRVPETMTIGWGAAGSGIAAGTASAVAGEDLDPNDLNCIKLATPVEPDVTTVTECGVYGTVVPKETEGVDYAVEFDKVTGEYTVTATPKNGYYFVDNQKEIVFSDSVGAYYDCVEEPSASIAVGECVYNSDGTANFRSVSITFDNTKSNVDVLFEVPYYPEYSKIVEAGDSYTFPAANIWPAGGGYTVNAAGKSFELIIEPCDEPDKPAPVQRPETIPSYDCTTAVVTLTTTIYTTDWVFDTEKAEWVLGEEVAGTPEVTTRPMTAEEIAEQVCLVVVTDPEASTCEVNDQTQLTSWIRVELNTNVEYTIDGTVVTEEFTAVTPGEHTVVATALNGYTLQGATPEPDDWTDTTHTWTFTAVDSATECQPETPTLTGSTAVGECEKDAPFISYSVAMNDPDSQSTSHHAYLVLSDGVNQETIDLGELVLNSVSGKWELGGKTLWPGASVDAEGNATGWPGWEQLEDGTWAETTGNFAWTRDITSAKIVVNPELVIDLAYPDATPQCAGPEEPPTLAIVLPTFSSTALSCTAAGTYTIGAEFGDVTWTVNGTETAAGTYEVTSAGTVTLVATPTNPEDGFDPEWVDEPIVLTFALPDGGCTALLAFTGAATSFGVVWVAALLALTGLGMVLVRRKNTAQ
jgi:hypothetical protein